jgi:hypothetical protein
MPQNERDEMAEAYLSKPIPEDGCQKPSEYKLWDKPSRETSGDEDDQVRVPINSFTQSSSEAITRQEQREPGVQ